MQTRIKEKTALLDAQGKLKNPGYATKMHYIYDRNFIAHGKRKIKEWDYYYIGNESYGICLTIADNGYMGMISVSLLEFKTGRQITKSKMTLMPLGKFKLPNTSAYGMSRYKDKNIEISFETMDQKRTLYCSFKNFNQKETFEVKVDLRETYDDTMVIATPFKKPKYFYLNQKINGMEAVGYFKLGPQIEQINQSYYGLLDWGRGVWTYKNTWYWASLSTHINGKSFGFNFGYGFGDTSEATENMIFYQGKMYKFNDIHFEIPKYKKKDDFLSTWRIYNQDRTIDLTFHPVLNRHAHLSVLVIASKQDQVFGYFKGTIKLPNKEIITLDNGFGFAEKVFNKW